MRFRKYVLKLPPILWYIELLESAELQAELGVGYQTDRGEGATEGAEVLYAEMAEAGINCLGDEIVIQVSDSDLCTVTALVPGALVHLVCCQRVFILSLTYWITMCCRVLVSWGSS